MKGFIFLFLALCASARADNFARPPQPYELMGVELDWGSIPYATWPFEYTTGYKLWNPQGLGCHPIYGAGDWFQCRIRVDPLTKTLTILTAVEIDAP